MPKVEPKRSAIDAERMKLMRNRARVGRAEFASKPGPNDLAAADADGGLAAFQDVLRACVAQLKAAREAAGLSLADVSRITEIAPESLSRLETGATMNPTWKTLGRIAVAVGCTLTLKAERV